MDLAFVDLQGFVCDYNNTFAVKEICILTKNIRLHEFVKPPFPFCELNSHFKKQAKWLENFYHGLNWNLGYISSQELQRTILPILKDKIVLVKGVKKVNWMKDILNDDKIFCFNLEDIDCDLQLSKQIHCNQFTCAKHKTDNSRCARSNAALLKKWFHSQSMYSEKIENLIK